MEQGLDQCPPTAYKLRPSICAATNSCSDMPRCSALEPLLSACSLTERDLVRILSLRVRFVVIMVCVLLRVAVFAKSLGSQILSSSTRN